MVAYGFARVPVPVVSLPPLAVVATNTPYVSVRMHGSPLTDGSSVFGSHAPLHT
jgi:hypothetical protein